MFLALMLTSIGSIASADESPPGSRPDIIRIASGSRTLTLDPTRSWNSGDIETFGQLYSRLFRRDQAGNLQPGLAERWEMSADARTYTFHLRDARFSDGTPITADDVRFTLLRMRDDPEALYSEPVSGVVDVVAVDQRTVRVMLAEPNVPFLDTLEVCFLGRRRRYAGALGAEMNAHGQTVAFAGLVDWVIEAVAKGHARAGRHHHLYEFWAITQSLDLGNRLGQEFAHDLANFDVLNS